MKRTDTNRQHHKYDRTTGELKAYPRGIKPIQVSVLRGRTEDYYVYEIIRLRQQNKRLRARIQQYKLQQNIQA